MEGEQAGIISIITVLRMYEEAGAPLPVNLTILFEGEEESGSCHMAEFLQTRASQLNAAALIVLDGINADCNCGSLTTLTRGFVSLTIKTKGLEKPVHSGIGCLAPDSTMALVCALCSLQNPMAIPGFTDGIESMDPERIQRYNAASQSIESYSQQQGVVPGATLRGNPEQSIFHRVAVEPNISISKMHAGQLDGGNVIPDTAQATINVRVLPEQDPKTVAQAIKAYVSSQQTLNNVELSITSTDGMRAWKSDVTGVYSSQYLAALSENFSGTGEMACGGTLPLLYDFKQYLPPMEMIVPGVEDLETAAHSHNESQSIAVMERSINSLASFLWKAGQVAGS